MADLPALLGRAVTLEPDGPVFDPALLAEALGLPPEGLRAALLARQVFSVVERGEGEDSGRHRLTLRHRATEAVLVVDAAGRIIAASRRGPPSRRVG